MDHLVSRKDDVCVLTHAHLTVDHRLYRRTVLTARCLSHQTFPKRNFSQLL